MQPVPRAIWRVLAGTVLALLVVGRGHAGDLGVTVMGIRSDAGALMIGLYDSGFLGPPSFDAASVTVGSADQAIAISLIY